MNCEQVAEKLLVPPDELSEKERVEVDEHVAKCSACRQMSEEWGRMDRVVSVSLENLAMQATDWPSLETEVMGRIAQTRADRRVRLWASGALAASLLIGVGLWAAYAMGGLRAENRSLRQAMETARTRRVEAEAALTAANRRVAAFQDQEQVVALEREKASAGTGVVVYRLFEQPPSEPRGRGVKLGPSVQWPRALMEGELRLLVENGGV